MIVLSLVLGSLIGLIDSAGFYWTVGIFLSPGVKNRFVWAGFLELARLAGLIIIIILLIAKSICTLWWMILPALFISLAGKVFVTIKKFTA